MSVCVFQVCDGGVGEGEGDAWTFNDSLCNSTLEVIITNTMHVVTFDPNFSHPRRKRERKGRRAS